MLARQQAEAGMHMGLLDHDSSDGLPRTSGARGAAAMEAGRQLLKNHPDSRLISPGWAAAASAYTRDMGVLAELKKKTMPAIPPKAKGGDGAQA